MRKSLGRASVVLGGPHDSLYVGPVAEVGECIAFRWRNGEMYVYERVDANMLVFTGEHHADEETAHHVAGIAFQEASL